MFLALALAVTSLLPVQNTVQLSCFPYSDFVQIVKEKFHQEPVEWGVETSFNSILLFFVAPDKSWTAALIDKNNDQMVACPILRGTGWQKVTPPAEEKTE